MGGVWVLWSVWVGGWMKGAAHVHPPASLGCVEGWHARPADPRKSPPEPPPTLASCAATCLSHAHAPALPTPSAPCCTCRQGALLNAVIIGSVNLVSTFVSIYFVDRAGRKKLLLQGGIQMLIAQVCGWGWC